MSLPTYFDSIQRLCKPCAQQPPFLLCLLPTDTMPNSLSFIFNYRLGTSFCLFPTAFQSDEISCISWFERQRVYKWSSFRSRMIVHVDWSSRFEIVCLRWVVDLLMVGGMDNRDGFSLVMRVEDIYLELQYTELFGMC